MSHPDVHNVRQIKFPQTRRDRLEAKGENNILSRLSSIHSLHSPEKNNEKKYYAPTPGYAWHQLYFGEQSEVPLATNDDSWSEWGISQNLQPNKKLKKLDSVDDDMDGVFTMDGTSPSEVGKVSFKQHQKARPSVADSFFDLDRSVLHGTPSPMKYQGKINVGSLILWGKEIASFRNYIFPSLSIIAYILDVVFDILLAIEYFQKNLITYFILTMIFLIFPALCMSIFSVIIWERNSSVLKDEVSIVTWVFRIISSFLFLTPIIRCIEIIYHAWLSRNDKHDWYHRRRCYERMLDEDTDLSLVRLFETFLENAPQLVLKFYVISIIGIEKGVFLLFLQCGGLIISWLSMAYSIVCFHAALRNSLPDKAKMTLQGKIVMFFWRLFTIASRVLAMAMFASHFHWWILAFCAIHFLLMVIWMCRQETLYCLFKTMDSEGNIAESHSKPLEMTFRIMMAFIHIFCFINMLEGHSRLRCLCFYVLVYFENAALILTWYIFASTLTYQTWYHLPVICLVFLGFLFGILLQILYYKFCHPNNYLEAMHAKKIRSWIPCNKLSLFSYASDVEIKDCYSYEKPHNGSSNHPRMKTYSIDTSRPSDPYASTSDPDEFTYNSNNVSRKISDFSFENSIDVITPIHGSHRQRYSSSNEKYDSISFQERGKPRYTSISEQDEHTFAEKVIPEFIKVSYSNENRNTSDTIEKYHSIVDNSNSPSKDSYKNPDLISNVNNQHSQVHNPLLRYPPNSENSAVPLRMYNDDRCKSLPNSSLSPIRGNLLRRSGYASCHMKPNDSISTDV